MTELDYVTLNQDALSGPIAWAFQNNSEFVDCFNYHFRRMDEGGLLSQLEKTIYVNRMYDEAPDKNDMSSIMLGYENVAFPCLVLLLGLVVAIFHLMAEWMWSKVAKKSGRGPWIEE